MSDNFKNIVAIMEAQQKEIENLKEKYQETMKKEFKSIVDEFFKAVPDVKCVCWTQYTPYFNDGDTCEFNVNDIFFIGDNFDPTNLEDPYEYESGCIDINLNEQAYNKAKENLVTYGDNPGRYNYTIDRANETIKNFEKMTKEDVQRNTLCKIFEDVISSNEDLMKAMFDDHVSVYLTRDDIIVEEYSHD